MNVCEVLNLVLFSLKVTGLFYLKYKARSDPGHIPTSEMELFLKKVNVAGNSLLDVGMGLGLTGC